MNQAIIDAIDAAIAGRTDSACPISTAQWNNLMGQLDTRIANASNTDVKWGYMWLKQTIEPWYDDTYQVMKLKHIRVLKVIMKGLM